MTHPELEEWLETIAKIILDVNISLNNADRLFENKYPNESNAINHGFFKHHYYQLWFITTIQLSKLVTAKKTQKYNLHFLLTRLRKESLDKHLLSLIESNKRLPNNSPFKSLPEFEAAIINYQDGLKQQSDTIAKITKSRNKLYAHRDTKAMPESLTLDQARELLNVCKNIYNGIRGGFYNISVGFNYTDDWSIDHIIKKCSE